MPADRIMPSSEAADLIELVRELSAKELAPKAAEAERTEEFPREVFRLLGRAGLLGLPYPEEFGGGGQPYEVYLQVVEEIASAWASVGVGVSVHALSCFGLATRGTDEQRRRWLPDLLGGELLGAYCLSEAHAGSDPAAMRTTATRDGDEYVLNGTKAWTTHGGQADFYKVMARTSSDRNGISCFLVPADTPGLTADPPEHKMGLTGSTTTTMVFDQVRIPAERLLGNEGDGLRIAFLLRVTPLLPQNVLTYVLASTALRLRDFAVGTAFGVIPFTVFYVYVGSLVPSATALLAGDAPDLGAARRVALGGGVLGGGLALLVIGRAARRALRRAIEEA